MVHHIGQFLPERCHHRQSRLNLMSSTMRHTQSQAGEVNPRSEKAPTGLFLKKWYRSSLPSDRNSDKTVVTLRLPQSQIEYSTGSPFKIAEFKLSKMAFVDRFQDHRTYSKRSTPGTPGATYVPPRPPPAARPDGQARRMQAIDNETECFEVERTGHDLATRLKTLRSQKELSQKDLAQRASVKVDVIRDYENGRGVPDGRLIARLEQILGGRLRDPPKKKK
jgi:putative transcription factor